MPLYTTPVGTYDYAIFINDGAVRGGAGAGAVRG